MATEMRIQILSDLHFEFHADAGASFVASIDPSGDDVLVLAGDLTAGAGLEAALALVSARWKDATVVYVHGNHEFYGSNRAEVLARTRAAERRCPNLRWLDCGTAVVGGRRFVGAPMWFPPLGAAAAHKHQLNDYHQIESFESWVHEENARALAFFDREIAEGVVVVTHYLPSRACIAPEFATSQLNPFFVCDVEPLIRERRPALWIHGHTHGSIDTVVGATRIVCNPFGYARVEENRRFRERLVVEMA